MMNLTSIKNLKTPIAVIGLGKSGLSALKLLSAVGFSNEDLISFDEKDSSAMIQDYKVLVEKKTTDFSRITWSSIIITMDSNIDSCGLFSNFRTFFSGRIANN